MSMIGRQLLSLLDLRQDTNYEGTDQSIRQNISFKSANAWTLVFAIFIASAGLNVNSAAVIIGAMLISPLMGPIVGAGYSLGINDFVLLKTSAKNLLYAVVISLITSTIYFLISPFNEIQSELLARTTPNFYDVVIAVFGGAAGIVALSRSEKSNAIPGVAIATALMPPLCTAGYGLANLNWQFCVGALYLFIINTVFICLTTYIFVRYLKFKKIKYSNVLEQKKINRWIFATAMAVVLPSLVTAWLLLSQSAFRNKAGKFIDNEIKFKGSFLVEKKINYNFKKSEIVLTLIGTKLGPKTLEDLRVKKDFYGLREVDLLVNQVAVEDHIESKLDKSNSKELPFKQRIADLELVIKAHQTQKELEQNLLREAQIFVGQIKNLYLEKEMASAVWKKRVASNERKAFENFIRIRTGNKKMEFQHSLSY